MRNVCSKGQWVALCHKTKDITVQDYNECNIPVICYLNALLVIFDPLKILLSY